MEEREGLNEKTAASVLLKLFIKLKKGKPSGNKA